MVSIFTRIHDFYISRKKISIQRSFDIKARRIIGLKYNIPEDEGIYFAWWTKPYSRHGFVFTENYVYYNTETTLDSSLWDDNDRDEDCIALEDITDISFNIEGSITFLTEMKDYVIPLNTRINSENETFIRDILLKYIKDKESIDPKLCRFDRSLAKALFKIHDALFSCKKPKETTEETETFQEVPQDTRKRVKFGHFMRHIMDLIVDLGFMASVFFTAKCFVHTNMPFYPHEVDKIFHKLCFFKNVEIVPRQASILFTILVSYIFCKFVIIATCHNIIKIVPILLTFVNIMLLYLVCDKFIVFLILYFTLYWVYQYSLGFSKARIKTKFVTYLISSVVLYVVITLLFVPQVVSFLISVFSLPVKLY